MKTIPFDIDKARAGAKVVTESGLDVTIVTYKSVALPGSPILAYYHEDGEDVYHLWPQSGRWDDPIGQPPELRLIKSERYRCNGVSVYDGDKFLFNVQSDLMHPVERSEIADRVAAALNANEEDKYIIEFKNADNISEVEYEEEDPAISMTRQEWQRFRERTEFCEEQNKLLGEESHNKSLEIEKRDRLIQELSDQLTEQKIINDKLRDARDERLIAQKKHYKALEEELAIYRGSNRPPVKEMLDKIKELTERVKHEEELNEKLYKNKIELEEEVHKWSHDCNDKQKAIDTLEQWIKKFTDIAHNYADARDEFLKILRASETVSTENN